MNRRIAYPFLTLSDSAVRASGWMLSLNGEPWQDVGDYLPHWDPSCRIRLRQQIVIDPAIAADDIQIPAEQIQLSVGVTIGTGAGRLPRRVLRRISFEQGKGSWQTDFELEVRGDALSAVLDLSVHVALALEGRRGQAFSPSRVGDRLWTQRTRLHLEGGEPRLPLEIADISMFLSDTVAASSPWYLHWSPGDWLCDFHGALRLYLNSSQPGFVEKIEGEDPYVLQTMMANVMAQVCERLVSDKEFPEILAAPEPGSLGAQAASWINKAWPGKEHGFIKDVLENRPGEFHATFFALARMRAGE